jgi:hypothetical protein
MASQAHSTYHDQMSQIANGTPILTLHVPDGKWVVTGKLNIDNDDAANYHVVTGRLIADQSIAGGSDVNHVRLAPSGVKSVDNAALAFNLVHEFPGNGQGATNPIHLVCQKDSAGANIAAGRAKITAVQVDTLIKKAG